MPIRQLPSFRPFLMAAVLLLAPAARAASDLPAMSGVWKPASAELAGRAMPPDMLKNITLTIVGAHYEVVVETPQGPSSDRGTIALDESAKPRRMAVTGVEGSNAGKVIPAIYELSGDQLRICYNLSGTEHPKRFPTDPRTAHYYVVYERRK